MNHSPTAPEPPGIGEVASRLREDLGMLRNAIGRERADLEGRLQTLFDTHPLATLAAGFGIGYVLGGGLLSRRTLSLFRLGARVAFGELFARTLSDLEPAAAVPP